LGQIIKEEGNRKRIKWGASKKKDRVMSKVVTSDRSDGNERRKGNMTTAAQVTVLIRTRRIGGSRSGGRRTRRKKRRRNGGKKRSTRITVAVTKVTFVGVLYLGGRFKCELTRQMTIWPKIKHEKNSCDL
jgi:hypothetical protein